MTTRRQLLKALGGLSVAALPLAAVCTPTLRASAEDKAKRRKLVELLAADQKPVQQMHAHIPTASGDVGPVRYAVIYNTATDAPVMWFDYGEPYACEKPQTFTLDWNGQWNIAG